jgi:hypothetical protein
MERRQVMRVSSYQQKTDDDQANATKGPQDPAQGLAGFSPGFSYRRAILHHSTTPSLRYSTLTSLTPSFAGNVLYPFLQYLQVLR